LGGDFKYNTIENAFDNFEDENSTQKLEIRQAPEPVKEHSTTIKEESKNPNLEFKQPVNKPVEKHIEFKKPIKEVSEPIKEEDINETEESSIEFELPISEDNDFQEQDDFIENDFSEKKKVDSNFQWDFIENDDDDDDEPQSSIF
jgi:hypothetical protein